MAAIELHDGTRAGTINNDGEQCVRRFYVNTSPDKALLDIGIPARFSTFEFNGSNLKATQFDTEPTDAPDVSIVTVTYTRTPRILTPLENEINYSSRRTIEEVPIMVTEAYVANVTRLQQQQKRYRWVQKILKFESNELSLKRRIALTSLTQIDIERIADQTGKIHRFNGRLWRFAGGGSLRRNFGLWELTYEWFSDPGFVGLQPDFFAQTLPPDVSAALFAITGGVIVPQVTTTIGSASVTRFNRAPFEQYLVIPQLTYSLPTEPGQATDQPRITIIPPQNYEPDGYLDLPGNPI